MDTIDEFIQESVRLKEIYSKGVGLYLDFETTNINHGNALEEENQLLMGCWSYKGTDDYEVGNELQMERLLSAIDGADFLVAHNAKFELSWLRRCGYDVMSKPVFCTQLAEFVIAGNRPWRFSLNECLKRRQLPTKSDTCSLALKQGVCLSTLPVRWVLDYCRHDIKVLRTLHLRQREELQRGGLDSVFVSRSLVLPVLSEMEHRGMWLDKERVATEYLQVASQTAKLGCDLDKLAGGINFNSSLQLRELLYETLKFDPPKKPGGREWLTSGGELPTSAPALAALKPKNKKQRKFVEALRAYKKANTKFMNVEKMNEACMQGGHVYAQFNQTVAATHRLTSTGGKTKIQLQNIDRTLKGMFTSRNEGWNIMEVDEASLEFRVAVGLTGDPQGFEDIETNHDPHSFTASVLFDEFEGRGTPEGEELRRQAKEHTFKPLFGGQSGTPRQKAYYAEFAKRYETMSLVQQTWVDEGLRNKKFTCVTGLTFYYPKMRLSSTGYIEGGTNAKNYPIQNFASAEILLLSLVLIHKEITRRKLQSFLISTVHDSVVLEVPPDETDEVSEICKYAMEEGCVKLIKALYGTEFDVPLEAEVTLGTHWGK